MSNSIIEKFHFISIKGRYIYGYLCLRRVVEVKQLTFLPDIIDEIICEFVSSDKLDVWQEKADEILPSIVSDDENDETFYKHISFEKVLILREYYDSQPTIVRNIIEEIIWLGLSNLYVGFNSHITFEYVKQIVLWLNDEGIDLPPFEKIKNCPIAERHGWGELTRMSDFIG